MAQAAVNQRRGSNKPPIVEPTVGVICIDNGGTNTKVLTPEMEEAVVVSSKKKFGNKVNPFGSRTYPEGTFSVTWKDKIYFFGMLMESSRRKMTSYTTTKSTDYFILSVLKETALYGYDINYLVTTTPYSRYSEEEIELIREKLKGEHEIEINNIIYNFKIEEVIVVPETIVASYAKKPDGKRRWIDLGSRTVGWATTFGNSEHGFFEIVFEECNTIEKEGLDITSFADAISAESGQEFIEAYVENIYNELSPHFDDNDHITAFGGGALVEPLVEEFQKRWPNFEVDEDPLTLQVRGMLEYALSADGYGSDEDGEE